MTTHLQNIVSDAIDPAPFDSARAELDLSSKPAGLVSGSGTRLSEPIETLLESQIEPLNCDILIVGSGYGASFAALELAKTGLNIWLLERGQEFANGQFPDSSSHIAGHVQVRRSGAQGPMQSTGAEDSLIDLRVGDGLSALIGCGLGGTSLINAGVVLAPSDDVLDDPLWPQSLRDDRAGLRAAFDEVRSLLAARPYRGVEKLPKFQALKRLSTAIPGTRCEPLDIAVNCVAGPNSVGVVQAACTGCGNCITGCNIGAKNTLTSNALPLARSRGVRLFTGVTAVRISPDEQPRPLASGLLSQWQLICRRTAAGAEPAAGEPFAIRAHALVIAAGTLGSSEIMLRSEAQLPGGLSEHLGRRFSGNGDSLAFGYGQRQTVDAVASPDPRDPSLRPHTGPTITGAIRPVNVNSALPPGSFLQDGTIPSSLGPVIGTVLATASLPKRYVNPKLPAWFADHPSVDPISIQPEASRHSQVILAMGRDLASGRLLLGDDGAVRISANQVATEPLHQRIDELLATAAHGNGFDGGDYIPNPSWKPLPDGFSQIAGPLSGHSITVHPLGGCAMGDSAQQGVVDHCGAVFVGRSRLSTDRHAGLYVLDGAILPCAIGANPLMMISALSLRAARLIAAKLKELMAETAPTDLQTHSPTLARSQTLVRSGSQADAAVVASQWRQQLTQWPAAGLEPPPAHLHLAFTEVLAMRIPTQLPQDWVGTVIDRKSSIDMAKGDGGLVLTVRAVQDDFWSWLSDLSRPWQGTATLQLHRARLDNTIPATALNHSPWIRRQDGPVATGTVTIRALRWHRPSSRRAAVARTVKAIVAFMTRRGLGDLAGLGETEGMSLLARLRSKFNAFRGFLYAGWQHQNWRGFDYEIKLRLHQNYADRFKLDAARTIVLRGHKSLSYRPGAHNPWQALSQIDFELSSTELSKAKVQLQVDAVDLARRRFYQFEQAPDTPAVIGALFALSGVWLRSMFQSHFWSLRGLDYDGRERPRPLAIGHSLLVPEREPVRGEIHSPEYSAVVRAQRERFADLPESIRLTRYRLPAVDRAVTLSAAKRAAPPAAAPLLLIHGLSHGGSVFTTDTIDVSLAGYFVATGRDVWVLDHRLSNRLVHLATQPSNIDQVALLDVAWAIAHVCAATGSRNIDVFAHCIGAAATAMAVLSGCATHADGSSMIRSLTLHAVHPWVVASPSNRLSGAIGAVYRDIVGQFSIDPVPPRVSTAGDQLLDRLAGSLYWQPDQQVAHEQHRHHRHAGCAVCNRMTLVYGQEWLHENLDPRTHEQFASLVGPAHISIFQHIFYLMLRQRLTNADGDNVYLKLELLEKHWRFPTLFATGQANAVFSPASAAKSALLMKSVMERMDQPQAVRLFMPPGIGHLDFLFGRRNAEPDIGEQGTGIFDALRDFMAHPRSGRLDEVLAHRWASAELSSRRPLAGPMFWIESPQMGVLRLNVWYEERNYLTATAAAPRPLLRLLSGDSLTLDHDSYTVTELTQAYAPQLNLGGQYWLVSVDLAPEQWSCEPSALELRARHTFASELTAEPGETTISINLSKMRWFERWCDSQKAGAVNARSLRLLLACCRWPGLPMERELVDSIFANMREHARGGDGVDALWLLGDQIYTDSAGDLFVGAESGERAAARYREAFSGERRFEESYTGAHCARLIGELPTWMVIDDHEIIDNWSGMPPKTEGAGVDESGHSQSEPLEPWMVNRIAAAIAYQWRRLEAAPDGKRPSVGAQVERGLWQTFALNGFQAFAMDTRSERQWRSRSNWREAAMIGQQQLHHFDLWLGGFAANDSTPKFVLSGSVFGVAQDDLREFPSTAINADDWNGYPATVNAISRLIVRHQPRNLIFVAGDYHLCLTAEVTISDAAQALQAPVKILSIVAGALSATHPWANTKAEDFSVEPVLLPNCDEHLTIVSRVSVLSDSLRQYALLSIAEAAPNVWRVSVAAVGLDGVLASQQWELGAMTTSQGVDVSTATQM